MSFTDYSSDPDWKETKMKTGAVVKQEPNASLNKPKYSQKFCEKWLRIFSPWLARCEDDPNKPFCRACQCRLDCNRCHLQRHERTSKHARNLEILINKGEGAARQNLSIRQERSKYYQQRKKHNASLTSQDASDMGMDTADDYIDEPDPDAESGFQFVQTEAAPGDQFGEESVMKQENISSDGLDHMIERTTTTSKNHGSMRGKRMSTGTGGGAVRKERMKLLMQIQKDKNDLMDSFKELMGNSVAQQSPPREKNHVDLFFESVSSSVKALSPKLIAETKMRVSQLICELELRALTENDASTSAGGAQAQAQAVVVSPETGTGAYIINEAVGHTAQHHLHHQPEEAHHYEPLS